MTTLFLLKSVAQKGSKALLTRLLPGRLLSAALSEKAGT